MPMLQLLLLLFSLTFEPRYWLYYPAMSEIGSITFSNRRVFIAVPDGIYILDHQNRHQRTLTAADGIIEKIRFAAFNPSGNELLIVCPNRLYQFLPGTGQVYQLNPPFKNVRSIAITNSGAFFETELGTFQKLFPDRYQRVESIPGAARQADEAAIPVTWYGANDTTTIHTWTFLSPYFILDEQKKPRPLTKAYPNERTGRLYVTSPNYGVIIYNLRSGFKEGEIRLGPPAEPVRKIVNLQGHLWFLTDEGNLLLDSAGNWRSYSIPPGEFSFQTGQLLLTDAILDLKRRQGISAILSLAPATTILGTEQALYAIGPDGKPALITELFHPVNALASVRDSILVGTDDGLFILTCDTLTRITDPFARFDWGVYSITQTRGKTFFGTLGRVLQLDPNNTWTQIIPPGYDLSQPVRLMTAAADLLFIAGADGIDIYNIKTGQWFKLDRTNGLPASDITALYADKKFLWVATPGIVSRYQFTAQLR
jgi:ligand-binding sensor domain-containing protein